MKQSIITRASQFFVVVTLAGVLVFNSVGTAQAAPKTSAKVKEAQTIMTKFGIPTGTIDGQFGPNTARGLCAFRQISGATWTRDNVSNTLLKKMRQYKGQYSKLSAVPAPDKDGHDTYILINQTCQTLTYVENGHYSRIMLTSTGREGHRTANNTYTLSSVKKDWRGWHCSSLYPEDCTTQTQGQLTHISNFGNMYNKRHVYGAVYIHGSTSVPTYPASHGCIRVTIADSDWLYNRNNHTIHLVVAGKY